MSEFGFQLKKVLEDSEISVNSFAKTIRIDRSYLYQIFNGTRTITMEKLHLVLSCELFTKSQRELLRTAYYTEKYGAEQYARITTILRELTELPQDSTPPEIPACCTGTVDETRSYTDRRSLCDAIKAHLSAACQSGEDFLYTNFASEQTEIDRIVYTIVRGLPEPIRFTRITTLDTTGKSVHNIQTIFSSLKYLSLNYNILSRYRHAHGRYYTGTPFPYFIYCSSGLMLFDASAENGIWIPARHLNSAVERSIQKTIADYAPLAIFPQNIFDLKNHIANFSQLEASTENISYAPCIGPYLTEEMLRDIANPEIPNIDYIIASTIQHYRSVQDTLTIFTINGLREFVETGVIHEFPQELLRRPLSPKFRTEIIRRMLEKFRRNKNNLLILDSAKIDFPKGYNIEFFHHDQVKALLAATTQRMEANDFLFNILIQIDDPVLTTDLLETVQYIIENQFVFSAHYTEHLLNDMLAFAQLQAKNGAST